MEFRFTLNDTDTRIISEGLSELTYKYAKPIIDKLQTQINEQIKAAEPPMPPETKPAAEE